MRSQLQADIAGAAVQIDVCFVLLKNFHALTKSGRGSEQALLPRLDDALYSTITLKDPKRTQQR